MTPTEIARDFARYPTGNFTNASSHVRAMAPRIAPLYPGARLAGPARTARITPGQNAAIHRAVWLAEPGEVLVVDGGASAFYGPFGDILATACIERDLAGLVIDGTVRDGDEVAELDFPVFCIGRNPAVTAKTEPGETDIPVTCGDIRVHPGDFVVGDGDGVVVIPAAEAAAVAAALPGVAEREEEIRAALRAGRTTYEIFGLAGLYGE